MVYGGIKNNNKINKEIKERKKEIKVKMNINKNEKSQSRFTSS
jgi:hypothetical protein